jgi:hypothetical protein
MKNVKLVHCLFLMVGAASCGSNGLDTLPTVSDDAGMSSASRLVASVQCPSYPGMVEISQACMFDSNGKAYAENGTMYVLPAAPPYGAKFVFKSGFAPRATDLTMQGQNAAIGVFAAPYSVTIGPQCCSEDNSANRIEATADLSNKGELTITVSNPVPTGYQIAIILNFGGLYRSRLSPSDGGPCDLPNQDACAMAANEGFAMRFYVGAEPSGAATQPVSSTAPATSAKGTCLLAYNDALVSGDACCYYEGAKNLCDTSVVCNDRSGAGCCLIYGTEATRDGQRCCLYADGGAVDGSAECKQLLSAN